MNILAIFHFWHQFKSYLGKVLPTFKNISKRHSVENSWFFYIGFYVKLIMGILKVHNLPFCYIQGLWIFMFNNFCIFEAEISQINKFQSPWHRFHVKSERQKNSTINNFFRQINGFTKEVIKRSWFHGFWVWSRFIVLFHTVTP